VVDSDDDNERRILKTCLDYGLQYKEYDNLPLGRKWNFGAAWARESDPDYLMIVGSDDIISNDTFDALYQLMHRDYDFAGLLDLFIYQAGDEKIKYWNGYEGERKGEPIGAFRVLSRRTLDRINWELWDNELNMSLDGSMTRRIKALPELKTASVILSKKGGFALDIKAGRNICKYERYKGDMVSAKKLLYKHLPMDEAEAILALEFTEEKKPYIQAEVEVYSPLEPPLCMPWDNYEDGLESMGGGKVLSILIPTIPGRNYMFYGLRNSLTRQMKRIGAWDDVEVLSMRDACVLSSGEKRNYLIDNARGKYVVFVDDDDAVSESYVERILSAIKENKGVDCVGLRGVVNVGDGVLGEFDFSLRHKDYIQLPGFFNRPPGHLCPIKRSIASQVKFDSGKKGSDVRWSKELCKRGLIKTEAYIGDDMLYYYLVNR
jgi:glycosyltransferase involved in cell wall biosynthesis